MKLAWLAAVALVSPAASASPIASSPIAVAERVADWQLARLSGAQGISRNAGETADAKSWIRAAFWIGLAALAERAPRDARFAAAIAAMGRDNHWQPGARLYHADDQAIGQAYLWAAAHGAGAAARAPMRARLDAVLADPPRVGLAFYQGPEGYDSVECLKRWCWCDALFMAPPVWIEMTRQTGDPRYARFALREYWATVDFLFDPAERLFYRDSRFFERRDAQGRKQFWARGNGWVFASMARIIPMLPKQSPDRVRMEALFKEMAARIADLQKPDGYWARRSSPPKARRPNPAAPASSPTASPGESGPACSTGPVTSRRCGAAGRRCSRRSSPTAGSAGFNR